MLYVALTDMETLADADTDEDADGLTDAEALSDCCDETLIVTDAPAELDWEAPGVGDTRADCVSGYTRLASADGV